MRLTSADGVPSAGEETRSTLTAFTQEARHVVV
jgi:hypothetical protein